MKNSRSRTKKTPVIQPQGSALPVAPEDAEYMQQQEQAREEIVAEDAARDWMGRPLKPWSEGRARLLDALCAADVPTPSVHDCDDATFITAMFPRAVKLLYLSLHEPEDWERLRPRLLAVIDAWGVKHVPGSDLNEKAEAVALMIRIEQGHQKVMAMQRPRRVKEDAEGN